MFQTDSQPGAMKRRFFLNLGLRTAVLASVLYWCAAPPARSATVAEAFDREVEAFMESRRIPGGALAVVRRSRLVYARGYGWADRQRQQQVTIDSRFRIASLSKPISAVAALTLVEQGKLNLDTPVLGVLAPGCEPAATRDARLDRVTLRHLLQHTGGWDREKSPDPMFQARAIAKAQQVTCPPSSADIIRHTLSQPLDFDPGTRYAYSNFGYCLVGRLIEAASGLPYDRYVQRQILDPLGIPRMQLGASLHSVPGEVQYYTPRNARARSVFPGTDPKVPAPYGSFCLEAMDAHGGWIASAVDLARFAAALDEPGTAGLLSSESLRTMYAPPPAPVARRPDGALADTYYACGWQVRPVVQQGRANYWHTGSLPGTFTLLVRRWDGLSWVVLFNQRSEDPQLPDGAIDPALHRAANAVGEWPEHDLFVPKPPAPSR